MSDEQKKMFAERDYFYHEGIIFGKTIAVKILGTDYRTDLMQPLTRFPHATHALTIQGLADVTATPREAIRISSVLSSRTPGTHNLCFVDGADHIFTGRIETIITVILEWLAALEAKRLTTGLWYTPPRANL
ncbi:hypothetical protein QCA50_014559 [Cerrena zonata]|uniref:Peptidase S9 prolyl oligopeptidase catalytic domain-containing protein n=1 Tax=Cerrena zonata TaxID=2478898 RepID=A0AAW0FTI3_9APHY